MEFSVKVGSVTTAQRGAKVLREAGLKPSISRLSNPKRADGCGYVINVKAENQNIIISVLNKNSVRVLGVEAK